MKKGKELVTPVQRILLCVITKKTAYMVVFCKLLYLC